MKAVLLIRIGLFGVSLCGLTGQAYAAPKTSLDAATVFGDCFLDRDRPMARAVVVNVSTIQVPKATGNIMAACLTVTAGMNSVITFSNFSFHYMLAQALVRSDYGTLRHFDFSSVLPLIHRPPNPVDVTLKGEGAKQAQQDFEQKELSFLLSQFGECVVRRQPDYVHVLLLAPAESESELVSFQNISTSLNDCVRVGQQIKFDRKLLKGVLALNFYRLAGTPAGAQVATLRENN